MSNGRRFHVVYISLLLIAVLASSLLTYQLSHPSQSKEAVYLVGAVTITDPERLPEYQAIAGPLAGKLGGYLPLAFAAPGLIEGQMPADALYFIERYDSLEGLQGFIASPEFRQAKLLRDQVADVHFMMWLPAIDSGSLPH
jgi:uncharacterized protein (DUF1330 family)